MACESIKAALAENERARTALAARLGPAQNDAQFAFDALQSALRLRTQTLSPNFVASYNGQEFRGPSAVEDYIAATQRDFDTKRDIRRDLGVEFNALFPEKERLEKELAECEARNTGVDESVDSAGQIAAESGQAAAEGAQTQNPQADPETLNQNGTVVTDPGVTTSSNAVQSGADPAANGVTVSAPSLPNNTSSSAGNVVTTETSPVTNTSTPASPSNTNSLIGDFGTSSATQSYIYRAVKITHHFKAGKFTQQLNGSLVIYDKLPQNQTVSTLNDPQQQAAARAQAAEDQAAAARAQAALTDPRRVDTAQTPPINDTANPSSPSSETPPANSEPLAPAETAPPTSGNQDVSVAPAPAPSGPVSVVMGAATITAEISRSTDGFFFSIKLPSGENYSASSVAGVVAGAQVKLQDPGDGDFNSLTLIVATFAQQQGPTLEAQLIAQNTAPAVSSVPSQNMAKEA
jgi:hypothetical protein